MGKHLEKALHDVGRKIQILWAERTPRKSGDYRRSIRDPANLVVTPRTVTVGQYADKTISYGKYVEGGHRAFKLPNRIRNWDYGATTGAPYKRLSFITKSGKRVVRTITPKSQGWLIPRMDGQKNAIEVPRILRTQIRDTLVAAAKKDSIDLIKNMIQTSLGSGSKTIKIKVN